jgi:putative peptidoglycan lipid II flippase
MVGKLINKKINSIGAAAMLLAVFSMFSRLLGVLRDRILAGAFGAGAELDIYYAAFRIPDFIFNLLVLGALSAGFIPIFTHLLNSSKKNNEAAWSLTNNLLNSLLLVLIILSALGFIFAKPLTTLIAPGFSPANQIITASVTRIMFLSPIFLGISSIFGGVLQSFKRFIVYSLAPIMYNLGIIIGALYFAPHFGLNGLAWGVVLGAVLHMLIQLPTVFSLGYVYKPIINFFDAKFRQILIMMIPRTLSLATAQINLLVITILASNLSEGSLSVFNFANNLQSFPVGIFGISFAVAAFPALSAVAFDKKKLVENFSKTLRQILFFIIPATVLVITLKAQIVRVILGTGQFDWNDTVATIDTLGYFAVGLFAQASLPLLVRVFYARKNALTPFLIGLGSVFINLILSLWLPSLKIAKTVFVSGTAVVKILPLGVSGLALAFSIAGVINFILLLLFLYYELGNLDESRIAKATVQFSFAALLGGVAVQLTERLVLPLVNMSYFWGVLAQGILAAGAGVLVYAIILEIVKNSEWRSLRLRVRAKLFKK